MFNINEVITQTVNKSIYFFSEYENKHLWSAFEMISEYSLTNFPDELMKVKLDLNVQLRNQNISSINPAYWPVSVFMDRINHCDVFVFKVCSSNCICVLWPLEGSILHWIWLTVAMHSAFTGFSPLCVSAASAWCWRGVTGAWCLWEMCLWRKVGFPTIPCCTDLKSTGVSDAAAG